MASQISNNYSLMFAWTTFSNSLLTRTEATPVDQFQYWECEQKWGVWQQNRWTLSKLEEWCETEPTTFCYMPQLHLCRSIQCFTPPSLPSRWAIDQGYDLWHYHAWKCVSFSRFKISIHHWCRVWNQCSSHNHQACHFTIWFSLILWWFTIFALIHSEGASYCDNFCLSIFSVQSWGT